MEEIWKKVTHLDLAYEVEVSNKGRVRKIIDNKIHNFSTSPNSRGYINIRLNHNDGKRYNHTVHRLVAVTFLGLRENLVINHIDGDKLNNNVLNLEWVTRSQNCQHSKGITHLRRAKEFSDEDILMIIENYLKNPIPMNELADGLKISRETLRTFFDKRSKKILTKSQYDNLRLTVKKNSNYGYNL